MSFFLANTTTFTIDVRLVTGEKLKQTTGFQRRLCFNTQFEIEKLLEHLHFVLRLTFCWRRGWCRRPTSGWSFNCVWCGSNLKHRMLPTIIFVFWLLNNISQFYKMCLPEAFYHIIMSFMQKIKIHFSNKNAYCFVCKLIHLFVNVFNIWDIVYVYPSH